MSRRQRNSETSSGRWWKISLLQRVLDFVRRHRVVAVLIALLYIATGILGIPRLHTELRYRVERSHARFVEYEAASGRERTSLPSPRCDAFSFPIFPGIVFCSEEFTIARLYGEGHWSLYWIAWPSPIQLLDTLTWIS